MKCTPKLPGAHREHDPSDLANHRHDPGAPLPRGAKPYAND